MTAPQACCPNCRSPLPATPLPACPACGAAVADTDPGHASLGGAQTLPTVPPEGPAPGGRGPRLDFLAPPDRKGDLGRLGDYRILGVLGHGGMGIVFRAEERKLARLVALKVMLPELAAGSRAKQRFLREARAAAKVEHDHIIPIYRVGEDHDTPYLAMPLLKGQSLAAALRANSRPPILEVLRIGREIADGLAAAHEAGLIHRDIKPGNVWLEGDRRRVKILDFGLARAAAATDAGPDGSDPLTAHGAMVGTPHYMPPEQARGEAVDARADLFSLGAVLYEMVTGRLPFPGPTPMAILVALATKTPTPPAVVVPGLPTGLSDLIVRLLAKDPAGRPASARGVADELRQMELAGSATLQVIPIAAPPGDPWADIESTATDAPAPSSSRARAGTKPSRSGRLWVALGVLVLAAAGVAATLLFPSASPKGVLKIDAADSHAEVIVKRNGAVLERTAKREITLPAGDYTLELAGNPAGFKLNPERVEIAAGGTARVRVTAVRPPLPVRPANDSFTEVHNVTPGELDAWAKKLPRGFRPVWVAARAGSPDVRLDAVAVLDPEAPDWELRIFLTEEGVANDWKLMSERARLDVVCTLQSGDIRVWVYDKLKWQMLFRDQAGTEQDIADAKKDALHLQFVSAVARSDGAEYRSAYASADGRDRAWEPALSAEELVAKVEQYRQKKWRPIAVSAHVGDNPIRYVAIFAVNEPAREWDFTPDLTTAEYVAALDKRRAAGYRPQAVTSAVVGGVVRYVVVWVEAAPGNVVVHPAPDGVTDFTARIGLKEDELVKWADTLPGGLRPTAVCARVGAKATVFDAIAVADGSTAKWTMRTTPLEKQGEVFKEMFQKKKCRCDLAFLYMSAAGVPSEGSVWVDDGRQEKAESWIGDRPFINSNLERFHNEGNVRPANVTAILLDEGHRMEVNGQYGSRLAWETGFDLTPDNLATEVDAYRKKDWRLESLSVGDTGPGARYFAVFVKDEDRVDWDFDAGLTPAQVEQAIRDRKAKKFRPASIVSEVDGGTARYKVVWVGYAPKK
jgi:serine/threonine protein kinase